MTPRPERAPWSAGALILSAVGIVAIAGLVAAAGFAWHAAIRQAERTRVLAEAAGVSQALLTAQRASWQRERAILMAAAGRRDTVLQTRIRVIRDTSWLPADTSPAVRLRACRAQLDTVATACQAYRDTAAAALAAADSLHAADSTALGRAALAVVTVRDTLRETRAAAARKPGWRGALVAGVTGVLAGLALALWPF